MIQGTMSGAGKSLLVTALCRIFREDGYRAAPFKSQNMALNSYITADGLEMGRAQAAQAEAAGLLPDVRMNPILLKPTSDVGSQVIVNGRVRGQYRAADYFKMKKSLVPDILSSYHSLAAENDILVIEGAGSPAEINLKVDDIVNMGLAKMVDSPVILVGDIDPGGVFAQLYGTIALLSPEERERIRGTVINKFRGDHGILRPGLQMLEDLTGVPVLGVIPYTDADIDDEDSLSGRLGRRAHEKPIDIAVIRLPRISNFTDFAPLEEHPLLGVRYVSSRAELGRPDMIILPGTKNTMGDLKWLRESGLEGQILRLASSDTPVLGVCGGFQMLGKVISDTDGVEEGGEIAGMGLLPVRTSFSGEKMRTRVRARAIAGPFAGAALSAYEIHMGRTVAEEGTEPFAMTESEELNPEVRGSEGMKPMKKDPENPDLVERKTQGAKPEGGSEETAGEDDFPPEDREKGVPGHMDGARSGNVFGTYLHGLFDSGELTEKLAEYLCSRRGIDASTYTPESRTAYRERQYEKLANCVRENIDLEALYRIIFEER